MAGDWIKFEAGTPDKPEVWAIASQLSIDPDAAVGKLLRVWVWFDQHTENGNAPAVTKMLLDRLVGVPGFCDAVVRAGWLADDGTTISISKFERHNGETAKSRALTAKRVAKHKGKSNAEGNAPVTPAPLPKEEKRREEIEANASPSPEAQEDDRLARWMFDLIAQAAPGTKEPKFDKWANTIRLMRERDHLSHRQIAEVFLWANRDPFWKTNILSPDKLREKFPQLAAKSQEAPHAPRNQPARQTASDKVNAALDAAFGSSSTGIVLEADFDRIDPHETAGCRSGSVSSVV